VGTRKGEGNGRVEVGANETHILEGWKRKKAEVKGDDHMKEKPR